MVDEWRALSSYGFFAKGVPEFWMVDSCRCWWLNQDRKLQWPLLSIESAADGAVTTSGVGGSVACEVTELLVSGNFILTVVLPCVLVLERLHPAGCNVWGGSLVVCPCWLNSTPGIWGSACRLLLHLDAVLLLAVLNFGPMLAGATFVAGAICWWALILQMALTGWLNRL
ncbi:hypothetical protein Nepgr_007966 [Nepenthes gracilis]|uniref:Uncharacterized protein n=1 Tax=Nepenthes gracilis TaxID=150966 RepID=A0AAD3S8R3_NEPGR|nr:hypothetical protein Nepgr_007966 [Nepenthes gracilis]